MMRADSEAKSRSRKPRHNKIGHVIKREGGLKPIFDDGKAGVGVRGRIKG
jgi:hypothetical protein